MRHFLYKVYAESILVYGVKKNIYIGIHAKDHAKEGPWVYSSSGTNLDFENWAPGKPGNSYNDCAHILANSGTWHGEDGLWYDSNCNWKYHFICEFV